MDPKQEVPPFQYITIYQKDHPTQVGSTHQFMTPPHPDHEYSQTGSSSLISGKFHSLA